MTKAEILAMEAGAELDMLVAKNVMRWEWHNYWTDKNGRITAQADWSPSLTIANAWEVAAKIMAAPGNFYFSLNCIDGDWRCCMGFANEGEACEAKADAKTAELAICRAALLI